MEPVRILHVLDRFNQGGIENFIMNVYRNIDRSQFQFDFAFRYKEKGCFDDEVRKMGGHIFYFDNEVKSLSNYHNSLKRIIEQNGPFVAVHSHVYYFSGYVLWVAKKCGVKVRIAHSHETQKGRKPTIIRKTYEYIMKKMIFHYSTTVFACSKASGDYVFGKGSNYKVLNYAIDAKRFTFNEENRNKIRKQLNIEHKTVLLNVGRYADQKNHFFLLDVFKNVLNKMNDAVLIIIGGDSPLKTATEEYINKNNLQNNVILLSNIFNTEDYYNAADMFLLPSKYEGFGIVLIESQATGLKTLVSSTVTREVVFTDLVEYHGIGESDKEEWANSIVSASKINVDRAIYSSKLKDSPFTISQMVKRLTDTYLS